MGASSSSAAGAGAGAGGGGPRGAEHVVQVGGGVEEEFAQADANVLNGLVAEGLRPDMALLPFQMPRAPNYVPRSSEQHVVTIDNPVNLVRGSLAVRTDEGPDGRAGVSFEYQATSPFRVAVHFAVHETQNELRAGVAYMAPDGRVPREYELPAGNGTFVQAPDDLVDLRGMDPARLAYEEGALDFPLVITLHRTGGDGAAPAEEKADEAGDAPEVRTAECETTYASLSVGEDGKYSAKVIRQTLLVDGFPFDVEEIYGLEERSADNPESTAECVVCLTEPRDTTILPCRHMCVCHECAGVISQGTNLCPVCRSYAHSLFRLDGTTVSASGAASGAAAAAAI